MTTKTQQAAIDRYRAAFTAALSADKEANSAQEALANAMVTAPDGTRMRNNQWQRLDPILTDIHTQARVAVYGTKEQPK